MRLILAVTFIAPSSSCSLREERRALAPPAPGSLLIEEALRVLELVERGSLEESAERLRALRPRFAAERDLEVVEALLAAWIESRRESPAASFPRAPGPLAAGSTEAGPPAAESAAERLRRQGIVLYSQGKVDEAIRSWREALEIEPADEEARALIRRAQAVLGNRG